MLTALAVVLVGQGLEWSCEAGRAFSFTWKHSEKSEVTRDERDIPPDVRSETRVVKGTATSELEFKGNGVLTLALGEVTWTVAGGGTEITLVSRRGKSGLERAKGDVRKTTDRGDEASAKLRLKAMEEHVARDYQWRAYGDRESQLGWRKEGVFTGGRKADALFRGAYVHGALPRELTEGAEWGEPLDGIAVAEEAGAKEIRMKVGSVRSDRVIVRGSIKKDFSYEFGAAQGVAGTLTIAREFEFSKAGHLLSGREEIRVKRSGAGESSTLTITQELTLKSK